MTQKFTQKWTLVAFVEPVPDGTEFFWKDWPPHVTLADAFKAKASGAELHDKLAAELKPRGPLELVAENDAYFGEHSEHHVMLLEKTPEILTLHQQILDILSDFEAVFNVPEYVGRGYLPHVSMQRGELLKPGESVKITSVSVVDMFPNDDGYWRRVVRSILF